jgi:hypothetical protein
MDGQLPLERSFISTKCLCSWGSRISHSVRIPTSASTSSSPPLPIRWGLVGLPDVKVGHVDHSGFPAQAFSTMLIDPVSLQVHFRFENDKLLLLTLCVGTGEVVLLEVIFEGRIVTIVVRLPGVPPITDEAPLVLHAAMVVELVVIVKAFAAEAAHRMALETSLIGCAGLVVAATHMLLKLAIGKELVLVRENLLVTGTEIAHSFLVHRFDMAMEVRPAKPRKVAISIGTVVP